MVDGGFVVMLWVARTSFSSISIFIPKVLQSADPAAPVGLSGCPLGRPWSSARPAKRFRPPFFSQLRDDEFRRKKIREVIIFERSIRICFAIAFFQSSYRSVPFKFVDF